MDTRRILVGGVVASLVLAMWEMIVEASVPNGAGLFGPPIAIGATIVRDLQGSPNPIPFDLAALVLGLMGHMMNSVILSAIFGLAVARWATSTFMGILLGMAWGAIVFVMMWFIVIPAVDPLMANLDRTAFCIGHLMWGAALGFLWTRYGMLATTRSAAA